MIRSRLAWDLPQIRPPERIVFTSADGILAHLALQDLATVQPQVPVAVLKGGTDAWVKAGFSTTAGMTSPLSKVEDLWYKPYEFNDAPETAMREYLSWELGLVQQVEKDGILAFRKFGRRV